MKKASVGVLILGFLIIVGILLLVGGISKTIELVQKFVRSAQGGVVSKSVKKSIESARKLYTNFQTAWDMAMNPWKYTYSANPAKPAEEVLKEHYGFEIKGLSLLASSPYFTCKDINCSDISIPTIYLTTPIYYNFLEPTTVTLHCEANTTYDDKNCFTKDISVSPSLFSSAKKGYSYVRCSIGLTFNKDNVECHQCDIDVLITNKTKCLQSPIIFKDSGFRVDVKLEADFSTTAETTYRALIIPETTFAEALSQNKDVYTLLKIDKSNYESGYYYGLLGYPKIDIARKTYNDYRYPIILFGTNWSYEILIFQLRDLEHLVKIDKCEISLIKPDDIDIEYIDPTSPSGCSPTYQYKMTVSTPSGIVDLFKISCGSDNKCTVEVDDAYLKKLAEDSKDLVFTLPICIRAKSSFVGDYADLIIKAKISYEYKTEIEAPYPVTYELLTIS
jgi:hypothetical protein